jgi:hypothetical protein
MLSTEFILRSIAIGLGATLVMDLWLFLRHRFLKVPPLNYALLGRWIGHMPRGRFVHENMATAEPVRGEMAIGLTAHYAIGIAFAGLLVATQGLEWARRPTVMPALTIGVMTVVAPLFIMQPAMGLGVAGSKTPDPARNRLRSLLTHVMYGVGLYAAAKLTAPF